MEIIMAIVKAPDLSTSNLYDTVGHQTVVIIDPVSGAPVAPAVVGLTNTELRAVPVAVAIQSRVCLGTQLITALSSSVATSLTIPVGSLVAEIQADGGVLRLRQDAGTPTATKGWRVDDGMSVTVDSVLASVRLLAQSGNTTSVQIAYFDKV
jgi:hypothetical protein